jgi:hypothetical protein
MPSILTVGPVGVRRAVPEYGLVNFLGHVNFMGAYEILDQFLRN